MRENSYEDYDEILPPEPKGELVHWMEPRPRTFGVAGLAIAAAGAFALGMAAALIALSAARVGPERRLGSAVQWRRLH